MVCTDGITVCMYLCMSLAANSLACSWMYICIDVMFMCICVFLYCYILLLIIM